MTNPLSHFLHKVHGTTLIMHTLMAQQGIVYRPLEQWQALRDRRLRETVRYAAETVPYYQDLFKQEGLDPAEIRTVADLAKLPLLDKSLVRQQPDLFVSNAVKGQPTLSVRTSGSTGTPVQLFHDRDSVLANTAYSERERAAKREMFDTGELKREVTIVFPENASSKVRAFVRANAFVARRDNMALLSFFDPIEKVISQLDELGPDVIHSYGSYLELLFRTLKVRKIKIRLPKLVIYYSDMLTEGGQRLIEEEFGIPVLSCYAANEAFKIGFTCKEQKGFHLHDDLAHVRLVNEHGHDVSVGEPGEVVLSNLVNRATVLLNYRLGDISTFSNEICPCGRTLPLLKNIEGRAEDILYLPNGQYLHPRLIWRALRSRNDIVQYQLIQQTPDRFELKLAMADRAAFEHSSAEIAAKLNALLGDAVTITPTYEEALEAYGTQKFRSVVSLVRRDKLAEVALAD
jgi:phenylacetate-CoA ligase